MTKKTNETTPPKSNTVKTLQPAKGSGEPYESTVAFEHYYSLGESRSVSQVLQKLGGHSNKDNKALYAKVQRWQRKYFWTDRVQARDYKHSQALQHMTSTSIQEEKEMIVNAIRRTVRRKFKTDEHGNAYLDVKLNDIYSLERAIKIMMLLLGEATDISMITVQYVEVVINTMINIITDKLDDQELIGDIAVALRAIKLEDGAVLTTATQDN